MKSRILFDLTLDKCKTIKYVRVMKSLSQNGVAPMMESFQKVLSAVSLFLKMNFGFDVEADLGEQMTADEFKHFMES